MPAIKWIKVDRNRDYIIYDGYLGGIYKIACVSKWNRYYSMESKWTCNISLVEGLEHDGAMNTFTSHETEEEAKRHAQEAFDKFFKDMELVVASDPGTGCPFKFYGVDNIKGKETLKSFEAGIGSL